MAKKPKTQAEKVEEQSTALAKMENSGPVAKYEGMFEGYSEEEIAELMDTPGTEEIPPDERRPPLIAWNLDMRDDQGNDVQPNMFYNCQSGDQTESMIVALLSIKRGREYSYYDEAQRKKIVVCRSFDMSTGQRRDDYSGDDGEWKAGDLFNCETCRYRMGKQGERKDCTITMRFPCYDLERNEIVVFNVMRSSFIPMSRYLERHFFGQLKIGKTRKDIPLYMLTTVLNLKEDQGRGKRFYVLDPVCDGPLASKETVLALKKMAEQIKRMKSETFADEPPENAQYIDQKADDHSGDEPPPVGDDDIPF
jgi:hypothetical protein